MIIKNRRDARVFKAFSDENRLMILRLLQGGERCACKLLVDLNISQSTLSHHMQILCDAGVVIARKEGKWTHYSLCEEQCEYAIRLLAELLDPNFARKQTCCEQAWMIAKKELAERETEPDEQAPCCVHMCP